MPINFTIQLSPDSTLLAMGRNEVVIALFCLVVCATVSVRAQSTAKCNMPKVEIPVPLKGSNNQTVKELCLITKPATYTAAVKYCKSRSMQLIKLDNPSVQKDFSNFLYDLFGKAGMFAFRVDGVWFKNKWMTEDGAGKPMASDLKWWNGNKAWCESNSATVTNIAWPMMKLLPGKMYLDGLPREFELYYWCEYKK